MMFYRPGKFLCSFVIVAFSTLVFQPLLLAGTGFDKSARISFRLKNVKLRLKRVGGRLVPCEFIIRGRRIPIKRQGGNFGIRMKNADMAALAPLFRQAVERNIAKIALQRIGMLTRGDRKLAMAVVKNQRMLINKEKKERRRSRRKAQKGSSSKRKGRALPECADRRSSLLGGRLLASYNRMMNSSGFFTAYIPPSGPAGSSAGGWAFVDDQSGGASSENSGGESDPGDQMPGQHSDDDDDEDEIAGDGGILVFLSALLLVTTILFAPVAAAIWAFTQPLTIATALTAFAGAVGAVTLASTLNATLVIFDALFDGRPFVHTWDEEDGFMDNSLDDFLNSDDFRDMLDRERGIVSGNLPGSGEGSAAAGSAGKSGGHAKKAAVSRFKRRARGTDRRKNRHAVKHRKAITPLNQGKWKRIRRFKSLIFLCGLNRKEEFACKKIFRRILSRLSRNMKGVFFIPMFVSCSEGRIAALVEKESARGVPVAAAVTITGRLLRSLRAGRSGTRLGVVYPSFCKKLLLGLRSGGKGIRVVDFDNKGQVSGAAKASGVFLGYSDSVVFGNYANPDGTPPGSGGGFVPRMMPLASTEDTEVNVDGEGTVSGKVGTPYGNVEFEVSEEEANGNAHETEQAANQDSGFWDKVLDLGVAAMNGVANFLDQDDDGTYNDWVGEIVGATLKN